MKRRIAVISDLHANASAVRAALTHAHNHGFDDLMIMGDLLTYGCDPLEVLDLVREATGTHGARLIRGNHDQLYFDLMAGNTNYFDKLPPWLRESIEWTQSAIAGIDMKSMFAWQEDDVIGDIYFAHANPFGPGNWTYLNAQADWDNAHDRLRAQGHAIGVFGHTHRAKIVEYAPRGELYELGTQTRLTRTIARPAHAVVDPGSVGQPRSDARACSMMFIQMNAENTVIELHRLDYDVLAQRSRIRASRMSDNTKDKLLSYFS
jgi:predicted phosphodiesterase